MSGRRQTVATAEPEAAGLEIEVDSHAGGPLPDPQAPENPTPGGAGEPGLEPEQQVVVAPIWAPDEIEAMLSGLWFLGCLAFAMQKWGPGKVGFAARLAARKGELAASAQALVPAFDAYVPKSIGGPAGVGFAGIAVMGDVIRMAQVREQLVRTGPAPDAPQAESQPAPQAPAAPREDGRPYVIPNDLRPPERPSDSLTGTGIGL